MLFYAEYNRVRRAGDTMEGDLDFAANKVKFSEHEFSRINATTLGLKLGAVPNAFRFADGLLDTSGATADTTLKIKAAQKLLVNDGTTDILKSEDGSITVAGTFGFSGIFLEGNNNLFATTLGFLWGIGGTDAMQFQVAAQGAEILMFDATGFPGGTHITLKNDGSGGFTTQITSGQSFVINDGTNDILDVSDSLLDMSDGTGPTEFLSNFYSQAAMPTLDTDGKAALWEDSDNNNLFLVARENGATDAIRITREKEVFYNATDYNGADGDFRARILGQNGDHRFTFYVPFDFDSLTELVLVGIPSAGAAGAARDIDLTSDYAASGEAKTTHSESDLASTYDLTGTTDELFELDISGVFSSLAGGDYGGIYIKHNTIGGSISWIGIRFKYKTG